MFTLLADFGVYINVDVVQKEKLLDGQDSDVYFSEFSRDPVSSLRHFFMSKHSGSGRNINPIYYTPQQGTATRGKTLNNQFILKMYHLKLRSLSRALIFPN